jgi:hypothetical protein
MVELNPLRRRVIDEMTSRRRKSSTCRRCRGASETDDLGLGYSKGPNSPEIDLDHAKTRPSIRISSGRTKVRRNLRSTVSPSAGARSVPQVRFPESLSPWLFARPPELLDGPSCAHASLLGLRASIV